MTYTNCKYLRVVAKSNSVCFYCCMLLILGEPPKPLPPHSPPLPILGYDALSQEVTGEYGYRSSSSVRNMGMNGLALSAGRTDHIRLFRIYVSRKAAGKARAVLEGLNLDTPTTDACFSAHTKDEEIVQAGLVKWKEGQGLLQKQRPTWKVIISAMEYVEIAQQHIKELEEKLASPV